MISEWKCFDVRELKQRRRRRQRERQKNNWFGLANNNFARASRFFVHFFVVTVRLRREMPNFTFCGKREDKTTTLFSFPEPQYSLLEFNSKKIPNI